MRKVTQQITEAFLNGRKLTVGNSMTDGNAIFLHGNKIAWRDNARLYISMCGWGTPTTRERLNGVLRGINSDLYVCQKNHEQLLINKETKLRIPMIQSGANVTVQVMTNGVTL
tara:strand:+ start:335 stop:673 length:339 start_codon:yes stop_codon:yes gene_type:complete